MIEKNGWYSVQEIRLKDFLPMLGTDYRIKQFIDKGLLKGNTVGKGKGKRYFVKGESIIKFLAKWEAGDYHN